MTSPYYCHISKKRQDLSIIYLCIDARLLVLSPLLSIPITILIITLHLDLPGPTQEEAWIPRSNSRIPPQLEKNHVVPPSLQDEALARSSVSRVVPRSVFKCEMIFGTLNATPKVPRHMGRTRGEHRGSWHHFIWAPSPLLIAKGGSIPLLCLQGVPDLLRAPQMRLSHEEIRDVASMVVPHAERPWFPNPLLIRTRCPDTYKKIVWMKAQHEGALTTPCIVQKRPQVTLTAQQVPVTQWTTREASGGPFLHTRQGLTHLSQLCRGLRSESEMERNPEVPASPRDEAPFHFTKPSGVPRGLSQLHSIPDFSEAPGESPWGHRHKSREPRYSCQDPREILRVLQRV